MTATAYDRNTAWRDASMISVPVAANAKILAGTMACANAAGFAVPGTSALNLAYLGMADVTIDNTGSTDGAASVLIRRGKAFKWANDGTDPVTQSSLGRPCFIVDNQTVSKTNNSNTRSPAGIVVGLEADGVWVQ